MLENAKLSFLRPFSPSRLTVTAGVPVPLSALASTPSMTRLSYSAAASFASPISCVRAVASGPEASSSSSAAAGNTYMPKAGAITSSPSAPYMRISHSSLPAAAVVCAVRM